MDGNYGHSVWMVDAIWQLLPEYFVITDPDLQLNENLPNDFLENMHMLCDYYKVGKVGFALDISDHDQFYQDLYCYHDNIPYSIYDWESTFWLKLADPQVEPFVTYNAAIDTTFFLGCKSRLFDYKDVHIY